MGVSRLEDDTLVKRRPPIRRRIVDLKLGWYTTKPVYAGHQGTYTAKLAYVGHQGTAYIGKILLSMKELCCRILLTVLATASFGCHGRRAIMQFVFMDVLETFRDNNVSSYWPVNDIVACSLHCLENTECASFFYSESGHFCQLHVDIIEVNNLVNPVQSNGTVYYKVVPDRGRMYCIFIVICIMVSHRADWYSFNSVKMHVLIFFILSYPCMV